MGPCIVFCQKNGVSMKSCALVWAIVVVRVATMYSPYYTASVWELQSRISPKSSHAPILTGKLKQHSLGQLSWYMLFKSRKEAYFVKSVLRAQKCSGRLSFKIRGGGLTQKCFETRIKRPKAFNLWYHCNFTILIKLRMLLCIWFIVIF